MAYQALRIARLCTPTAGRICVECHLFPVERQEAPKTGSSVALHFACLLVLVCRTGARSVHTLTRERGKRGDGHRWPSSQRVAASVPFRLCGLWSVTI